MSQVSPNEFIIAAVLVMATLIIQSTGMGLLIVWARARFAHAAQRVIFFYLHGGEYSGLLKAWPAF
jgi:hypothetical protein